MPDEKGGRMLDFLRVALAVFSHLPGWAQIWIVFVAIQIIAITFFAIHSRENRAPDNPASNPTSAESGAQGNQEVPRRPATDWEVIGGDSRIRTNNEKIESMRIEAKFTSKLALGNALPITNLIVDQPAYLLEETGRQRTVKFRATGERRRRPQADGCVEITDSFELSSGAPLGGCSVEELRTFSAIEVPIGRAVNGEVFEELVSIEISLHVNNRLVWAKRRVLEIEFPDGKALKLPLGNVLEPLDEKRVLTRE